MPTEHIGRSSRQSSQSSISRGQKYFVPVERENALYLLDRDSGAAPRVWQHTVAWETSGQRGMKKLRHSHSGASTHRALSETDTRMQNNVLTTCRSKS